jgi:hypothetical protein
MTRKGRTPGKTLRLFKDGDYFLLEKLPPTWTTLALVLVNDVPAQAVTIRDLLKIIRSAGEALHGKKFAVVKFCKEIDVQVVTRSDVSFVEAAKVEVPSATVPDRTAPLPFPEASNEPVRAAVAQPVKAATA